MCKLPAAGLALFLIAVPSCGTEDEGSTGPNGPISSTTGSILVSLTMSGADLDADGCGFTVDSGAVQRLNAGGTAAVAHLSEGIHEVVITEVASNCRVEESPSRAVTVVAGEVTRVDFSVICDWASRIAFSRVTSSGEDIYVMNPDGTGGRRLTSDPDWSWNPTWSPDGSRIAFERGLPFGKDDSDYMDIYLMNADGTAQVRLTSTSYSYRPTWSPDGGRIAFLRLWAGSGLYVMNSDGSSQHQLVDGNCSSPTWAPDGSRIAFVHDGDIYVIGANGTGQANLTNTPGGELGVAWSPDGDRIAYGCYEDNYDESRICTMYPDGTGRVQFSAGTSPAWSPDGSKIAFVDDGEIYVMSRDGSGRINVTNRPGSDSAPSWSPDGSRIAFLCAGISVQKDVCAVAADGTDLVNLTDHPEREYYPSWSPRLY
jgi:Tol biopolymer transport system component